jgi:hypothetical protein
MYLFPGRQSWRREERLKYFDFISSLFPLFPILVSRVTLFLFDMYSTDSLLPIAGELQTSRCHIRSSSCDALTPTAHLPGLRHTLQLQCTSQTRIFPFLVVAVILGYVLPRLKTLLSSASYIALGASSFGGLFS